MKIVLKFIFGFLIVISLTVIVGYFTITQLQQITMPLMVSIPQSIEVISKQSDLDSDAQFIRYYDEVLTQSARNYAFTQDKKWEERYSAVEPKLDLIIKDTIKEGDAIEKDFFLAIDKANLALVEMEYKSIDLVNKGQASEAVKILESNEYLKQKKIYEQGLIDYITKRGVQYDEALVAPTGILEKANMDAREVIDHTIGVIIAFIVLVLIIVVVSGFLLTRFIHVISSTELKYRALYENSPILLATIDKNGIILNCNDKFAKRLGYTKNSIIGKSLFDHIANSLFGTESIMPIFNELLQKLEKNGFAVDIEMIFKKKDNFRFPVLASANYSHMDMTNIDLTIKDATEIYFSKLRSAENAMWLEFNYEKLRRAAKTKDEFLTMVTHELKTPLVPIKGYIDLLLRDKFGTISEIQKEKLKIVKNNVDLLHKLITDMMDSQKIEHVQFKITKNQEDLSKMMHDIILELQPAAQMHEVVMTSEIENDIFCLCDKGRIKEVLINLITNAIEFRAKKDPQIQIKLERETSKATIVVKDNGKGMQPENINKLFTRFYQVDTSLTREHGGMGLGLSICKEIMEKHGGRIFAKSEGEGKGSEFHMELPLNELVRPLTYT